MKNSNIVFRKRKYSKAEKKRFPFVYALIAFPVLQFFVFWFCVNISSIGYAFLDSKEHFTFQNFIDVFNAFGTVGYYDIHIGKALLKSLILWTISTFVTFPISIITTYVLFRRIRGHYIFRMCYIIPGLMGTVVFVMLIRYMVQWDGPITQIVEKIIEIFKLKPLPELARRNGLLGSEETAFPTLVIIYFILGIVGNNAVITGAFSRIPIEIFESAEMDGAGFWTICFKIAIPCIWPTITMLLTFSLCSIFTADCNAFLYTDGTGRFGLQTIGYALYAMTYQISVNGSPEYFAYGYPAALGLVLTLMTLPIVLFGKKILDKLSDNVWL